MDFPRNDKNGNPIAQIRMVILKMAEINSARADAERFARKVVGAESVDASSEAYRAIFNDDMDVQLLFRACRRMDDVNTSFFPSPTEMRNHLTPDELGIMIRAYLLIQAERGPIVSQFDQKDFDAWIARLKEGGNSSPLASLSSDALKALVKHLVFHQPSYATGTPSPGSPQAEETDASFQTEG